MASIKTGGYTLHRDFEFLPSIIQNQDQRHRPKNVVIGSKTGKGYATKTMYVIKKNQHFVLVVYIERDWGPLINT